MRNATGTIVTAMASPAQFAQCTTNPIGSTCGTFGPDFAVPNQLSPSNTAGLGVASYSDHNYVMVVYAGNDSLYYQVRDKAGAWTNPAKAGTSWNGSNMAVAVEYPLKSKVNVFLGGRGGLSRTRYTESSKTWDTTTAQKWSDGTIIDSSWALAAATVGYRADKSGAQLFGLFLSLDQVVTLAWWDSSTDRWTRFSDSIMAGDHVADPGYLGLAYVPFKTSDLTKGRFYVAYKAPNIFNAKGEVIKWDWIGITESEGNDPRTTATKNRLTFHGRTPLLNEWWTPGGLTAVLAYDSFGDTNLRAITTGWPKPNAAPTKLLHFWPLADGVENAAYHDVNDLPIMFNAMAGSLVRLWP
jgi:hypothetical protein